MNYLFACLLDCYYRQRLLHIQDPFVPRTQAIADSFFFSFLHNKYPFRSFGIKYLKRTKEKKPSVVRAKVSQTTHKIVGIVLFSPLLSSPLSQRNKPILRNRQHTIADDTCTTVTLYRDALVLLISYNITQQG